MQFTEFFPSGRAFRATFYDGITDDHTPIVRTFYAATFKEAAACAAVFGDALRVAVYIDRIDEERNQRGIEWYDPSAGRFLPWGVYEFNGVRSAWDGYYLDERGRAWAL